ncbi:hypothetical protein MKEN_01133800 [Mycena kentingensis (nom. inval.)]|nr:hypothetical protein MKEN_01133800 [Mycena kentingensis (nom. inval.)]
MPYYSGIFGLCYYYEHRYISLPLLSVRAEASIKELAAQVKLTQTYGNDATFPIEATYTFPIPARAAVCSFVMVKQDGTRVVGVVQEKGEARETYNAAIAAGQQASLAEQQTPDVFQVSVGNIPSKEKVEIELIYATELAEDEESDSVRFHLPVHIGSRYGHGPQSPPSPFRSLWISSSSPTPFLTLGLSVEAPAPISKIGSPSHTVSTELGPDPKLPNFKELPFSNYARVSLTSDSALDKDFVLTIKSTGLDAPRCIAELHPTDATLAMGLTLVPRFKLPDVSRQEFVLLVDRSGSMGGKRIEAARKALVVMLRAIPHKDSLFQIASFGNRCTFLWSAGSRPYNQETLEQATQHVDSMRADYGGTEIRYALHEVFRARKTDRPLSVLMLTDGDAWDLEGVLEEVKTNVEGAPKDAYIRVSVLGIGNSVSTAMCEGIARLGNGTCMLVGEEEASFTGKISRMLKAAKSPPIVDIKVDWGRPGATPLEKMVEEDDDFEIVEEDKLSQDKGKKKLNIFDESIEDTLASDSKPAPAPSPVVLPPPSYLQQAPFKIQNLFPNVRLNIYAILQDKTVPSTVTISGRTLDGAEIDLPIPVTLSHLPNAPEAPPAIHALAARKIIQDLEDIRSGCKDAIAQALANPDDPDLLDRTVKALIVRLGKTYKVASTHTSFVAVDESVPEKERKPMVVPVVAAHVPTQVSARLSGGIGGPMRMFGAMPPPAAPAGMGSPPPAAFGAADISLGAARKSSANRMAAMPPPPPRRMALPPADLYDASGGALPGGSMLRSRAAPPGGPAPQMQAAPLPIAKPTSIRGGGGPMPAFKVMSFPGQAVSEATSPPSDPLETLARMQAFDGRFSLDVLTVVKLAGSTNIDAVRAVLPAGASDAVVATILAMAFLANKLGAGVERDSWEGIYEKAEEFVDGEMQGSETAKSLEAKVLKFLA